MARFAVGVMASSLKMPDPASAVAAANEVGAQCLQVSNSRPSGYTCEQWVQVWKGATAGGRIAVASCVTGFPQEDYSTIDSIHRTGGLVPDDVADANIANVLDAIKFTAALGADLLTFHVGFVPESPDDPIFVKLLDRLGRCADAAAARSVRLGLESGQESANTLRQFLDKLNRPNVGVNFDPANMILYGRQEPLEAMDTLADHVLQVHAKDATWSDRPGLTWGREVSLGSGAVDFPALVTKLSDAGFAGGFIIEREAGQQPLKDIAGGVEFLRRLLA